MQLSIATLVCTILASLVSSQSVSSLVAQLPSCSISCLATASSSVGCAISDYACQCGAQKAALTAQVTPCVIAACSGDDALKTSGITADICNAATDVQTSATFGGSIGTVVPPPATSSASVATTVATSVAPTTAATTATSATEPPASVVTGAASRAHAGGVFAALVLAAALVL